eukprot:gene23217-biopygen15317
MSSDHPEVFLQLLSALVPLFQSCEGQLSGQEVGNALYGLRNMSSDHPEVLQLLTTFAPLLQSCEGKLSGQNIGNALYGLRNMSSDHPEVLQLLTALAPLLQSCEGKLSGQSIGNALYGWLAEYEQRSHGSPTTVDDICTAVAIL